jgi:hypothetical protein
MGEKVSVAWKGILDGTELLQSKDDLPVQEPPCECSLHHGLKIDRPHYFKLQDICAQFYTYPNNQSFCTLPLVLM